MSSGIDCWGGMALCAGQQTWGKCRREIGFIKTWTWEQTKSGGTSLTGCVNKTPCVFVGFLFVSQELTRFQQKQCCRLLENRDSDVSQQKFDRRCGISDAVTDWCISCLMHACMHYACVENGPVYWKITSAVTVGCYMWWKFSLFQFTCTHNICRLQVCRMLTIQVELSLVERLHVSRASRYQISTWARHRDESSLGRSDRAAVFACALPATMLLSRWAAEQCLYWLGEILLNPITPILSTKTSHGAADGGWRFSYSGKQTWSVTASWRCSPRPPRMSTAVHKSDLEVSPQVNNGFHEANLSLQLGWCDFINRSVLLRLHLLS